VTLEPLAFVVVMPVAPGRTDREVAAIRLAPDTLKWQALFTGREPAPVTDAPPGAPREMPRAELGLGLAAVVRDARIVAWDVATAMPAVDALLTDAGRTVAIVGPLDLASAAAPYLDAADVGARTLGDVAAWVTGAAAPPARALAMAAALVQLWTRIVAAAQTSVAWGALQGDEARIAVELIGRLTDGRTTYGPWRLDDRRKYPTEALAEVLDGLDYAAAQLVRLNRRRRVAYVATGLPPEHTTVALAVAGLLDAGWLPLLPWQIRPQLARDGFTDLDATRMLLETVDEVRVVGELPGDLELVAALARALDVPVVRDGTVPS
jgi:hypothetical protein